MASISYFLSLCKMPPFVRGPNKFLPVCFPRPLTQYFLCCRIHLDGRVATGGNKKGKHRRRIFPAMQPCCVLAFPSSHATSCPLSPSKHFISQLISWVGDGDNDALSASAASRFVGRPPLTKSISSHSLPTANRRYIAFPERPKIAMRLTPRISSPSPARFS